jgi:hypothetical protein
MVHLSGLKEFRKTRAKPCKKPSLEGKAEIIRAFEKENGKS